MGIKMSDVGQLCPDVLKAYLKNYSLKLSASEIAKEVKIERRTVSRILNKLVIFNLINYFIQGKNKLFYFDLKKMSTFSLLNLVEINNSINFNFKNKEVSVIISKLLDFFEGIIVFGSYASSKEKDGSDLDIVLLGEKNNHILEDIKKISLIEINEHFVNYKEFKEILKRKNPLAIEISKNHVLFGNFSAIIKIFLEDKLNG